MGSVQHLLTENKYNIPKYAQNLVTSPWQQDLWELQLIVDSQRNSPMLRLNLAELMSNKVQSFPTLLRVSTLPCVSPV